MLETVTVDIEDWAIARGKPCEARACPIALAFKACHPRIKFEGIATDKIFLDFGSGTQSFKLTREAMDWIAAFDRDEPVYPGRLPLFVH